MKERKSKQQIEEKLAALRAELATIDEQLAKVKELETRRRSIVGGFGGVGELQQTKLELRDCEFPVYQESDWETLRIIAVDEKWISVRKDGRDEVKRYRRSDGGEERSRNIYWPLDVAKALQIWQAHQETSGGSR